MRSTLHSRDASSISSCKSSVPIPLPRGFATQTTSIIIGYESGPCQDSIWRSRQAYLVHFHVQVVHYSERIHSVGVKFTFRQARHFRAVYAEDYVVAVDLYAQGIGLTAVGSLLNDRRVCGPPCDRHPLRIAVV